MAEVVVVSEEFGFRQTDSRWLAPELPELNKSDALEHEYDIDLLKTYSVGWNELPALQRAKEPQTGHF